MILLHQISGIADAVPAERAFLYVDTTGIPSVKKPDGSIGLLQQGLVGISGLIDQLGTFASGHAPGWDGTNFRQMSLVGAAPDAITITASGTNMVPTVIGTVTFANGTSGYATWSGIPQIYDWLEIHGETQLVGGSDMVQIQIFFNNDHTAANYFSSRVQSNAISNQHQEQANPTIGSTIGQAATRGIGNYRCPDHIIIPDYSNVGHRKYAQSLGPSPNLYIGGTAGGANMGCDTFAVQWKNTTGPAINMIEIGDNAGAATLTSGTILTLVGYKQQTNVTSGTYGVGRIVHGRMVP